MEGESDLAPLLENFKRCQMMMAMSNDKLVGAGMTKHVQADASG